MSSCNQTSRDLTSFNLANNRLHFLCGTGGRRGYLHHLAVSPESLRRGVGRALLEATLSALHRIGIRKCHAFVFQSNPFGELFWERPGWQRRDELQVYSKTVLLDRYEFVF